MEKNSLSHFLFFIILNVSPINSFTTTDMPLTTITTTCSNLLGTIANFHQTSYARISSVQSITIVSDEQFVYALNILYSDGYYKGYLDGSAYNLTESSIILLNNNITGLVVEYGQYIHSIQFEIYDPVLDTKNWTKTFGGSFPNSTTFSSKDLNNFELKQITTYIDFSYFEFPVLSGMHIYYSSSECYVLETTTLPIAAFFTTEIFNTTAVKIVTPHVSYSVILISVFIPIALIFLIICAFLFRRYLVFIKKIN